VSVMGFPSICVSEGSRANVDFRGSYLTASSVLRSRSGPSIGCRKKMLEAQGAQKLSGLASACRIDEFKFVTGYLHKLASGFWTDADPIDAGWSSYCSVCLDSDLKAKGLDRRQKR